MTPQATRRLFIVFILMPKEAADGEQCGRLRCKVEYGWSQCRRWSFYCTSDETWCHAGPKYGAEELLVLKSGFIVSFWSVQSKLEACWGCTVRHCLQSEIISFFMVSLGEHPQAIFVSFIDASWITVSRKDKGKSRTKGFFALMPLGLSLSFHSATLPIISTQENFSHV